MLCGYEVPRSVLGRLKDQRRLQLFAVGHGLVVSECTCTATVTLPPFAMINVARIYLQIKRIALGMDCAVISVFISICLFCMRSKRGKSFMAIVRCDGYLQCFVLK